MQSEELQKSVLGISMMSLGLPAQPNSIQDPPDSKYYNVANGTKILEFGLRSVRSSTRKF